MASSCEGQRAAQWETVFQGGTAGGSSSSEGGQTDRLHSSSSSCRPSHAFLRQRADDADNQASYRARCMLPSQVEQPSSLLLAGSATYSHAGLGDTLQQSIWPGQIACGMGLAAPHVSWATLRHTATQPLWPQLACAQCCKLHLPCGQQCMLPTRPPATVPQLACMRCSKLRTPSCTAVAISWRTVSAMPTLDCSEDSPNRWLWLMLSAAVGAPGAAVGRPATAISLDACQLLRSCCIL